MPEASLAIKIDDRYSSVLKSMSNVTKAFDKDVEHLEKTLHSLSGEKSLLQAETNRARKAMLDAQKQFAATRDQADALKASLAGQEYEDYRRKLEAVTRTLKETEEQIQNVGEAAESSGEAMETAKDGAGGMGGGGINGGLSLAPEGSVWSFLSKSGTGKMFMETAANAAGAFVYSALGDAGGTIASSIGAGIAAGAAGGALFGLPGAVIGGVIGGATGMINGIVQVEKDKDDAFKDYYRGLYEDVNAAAAERLAAGSSLAAGRENDLRALTSLLGGDRAAAESYQAAMVEIGRTPPFSYDTAVSLSRDMLGLGLSARESIDRINGLANAAAALGLSDSQVKSAAGLLETARLSGTMDVWTARSVSKMGINIYETAAEVLGTGMEDVQERLQTASAGEVGAVVDAVYDRMKTAFPEAADSLSDSYTGLSGMLESWKESIAVSEGERYDDGRKEALAADIAAYSGALGDKLMEVGAIGGEVQAYSENLRDQYQREALSAVLLGDLDKENTIFSQKEIEKLENFRAEFAAAEEIYNQKGEGSREAGLEMTKLKEDAEALAKAAYESSEWAQKEVEAEIEQIEAIRDLTKVMVSATNAWRINNALSKGRAAGNSHSKPFGIDRTEEGGDSDISMLYKPWEAPEFLKEAMNSSPSGLPRDGAPQTGFAFGLEYVPYDNFPALLHQGERVLTAAEARGTDRGGVRVTVTGNEFHVRRDSDVDAIAETLARKLRTAMLRGGG